MSSAEIFTQHEKCSSLQGQFNKHGQKEKIYFCWVVLSRGWGRELEWHHDCLDSGELL